MLSKTKKCRLLASLFIIKSLFAISASLSTFAQAQQFRAEGSDTGSGVGARQISMGGSGAASAEGAYTVYYNPAAMDVNSGFSMAIDRQLNAELRSVSFFGATAALPTENFFGIKSALGIAYFPRVHARASGSFAESDFESIFLRYLLPGLNGTFDGDLESKTKVYRLAFNAQPSHSDKWSIGLNVDYVDCQTRFCGTTATSNGYTISSGDAKATSFGLSVLYKPSDELSFGGSITDLGSDLSIDITTTDDLGTSTKQYNLEFPLKALFGFSYQWSDKVLIAGDYEILNGDYGRDSLNFQIARLGGEYQYSDTTFVRIGALMPFKLESSEQQEGLDLPFPFVPTGGLGWRWDVWQADLAIYPSPVQSAHEDRPVFYSNLSLSVQL